MTTKEQVLKLLEDNESLYLSGEELSEKTKVSRMAVFKAIKSLRKSGYEIESKKHYGYRLVNNNDILDKEALVSSFGNDDIKVYYLDETVSTNRDAKIIASDGAKPPYVVTASFQSGGRGRLGRKFESPRGGVYFSLVLDGTKIKNPDLITIFSATAISEVLEKLTGIETSIKWVNDIYIRGKKAVGILTEGIFNMEQKTLDKVVIGCGINLKTKREEFSPEVLDIATSFYPDGNCPIKRADVIALCCKRIVEIQNEDFLSVYKKKCFVLNKRVKVIKMGETKEAYAYDLDSSGHLMVRYDNGEEESLSSGEISIRL